jgi:hypothetical protein
MAHSHPLLPRSTPLVSEPARTAALASVRSEMLEFHPGGVSAVFMRVCLVTAGEGQSRAVLTTTFVDVPPSLGARGARIVALGERARAAGDAFLANTMFCFAAGAAVATGNERGGQLFTGQGNPAAEFNRAVEYVELGGGGVNAGLNVASLGAGSFWAARAALGGHADAPALLEWIEEELARWA